MQRGEIWWADLPTPTGSEPGSRRPVLILQHDDYNRSRITTVIAVILTSNLRLQAAPGNVLLSARDSSLPRDSVANVSQVVTLYKSVLAKRVASLPAAKLKQVDNGVRLVLGL
jgi:mRNA interferase MazF